MRDDLALAAYAVHIGYTIKAKKFDSQGIPHDGLSFTCGDVTVWETAWGWRVGKLENDRYCPPSPDKFFKKLKAALDAGKEKAT
jgi:hypothetical protein